METLTTDEATAFDAAYRIKLRQETGINPAAINEEMTRLLQAMHTPERATSAFAQGFISEPLSDFCRETAKAFGNFRDSVVCRMVSQYRRCLPSNVTLHFSDFVYDMHDKAGTAGFDAGIVEDRLVEMLPEISDIAFRQLRDLVEGMVYSGFASELVDDNRLILWVPLGMRRDEAITIIGKLSRIVLLGEDPATVQECKRRPTGFDPGVASMEPGEPIIEISHFEYADRELIRVEYESPEKARRVAEVLVRTLVWRGWHETVGDR